MKNLFKILGAIILAIAVFTSNSSFGNNYDELGPKLTKLTSGVVSMVRYRKIPKDISDIDLLLIATKDDPGMLEPFNKYSIKIRKDNKNVVILVGTKDGEKSLLEDASWTYELDKQHWKSSAPIPFDFTIDLPIK